jgi:hypothetical protein
MKWEPVKDLLRKRNIQQEYSLPHAHHQNLVERYVQTVNKAVSTIIHGQSFVKSNLWNYALFYVVDCQNTTPNVKTGNSTPNQLVTGIAHLDLERENLFSFGELVIVQNTDRTWKFDLKNDVAIYLGHPKGSVNGGIIYYPYVNKITSRANITPAKMSEEAFKRYFARRYEIKEQSTMGTLSDLLDGLQSESAEYEASRWSVRLCDEDEIPTNLQTPITLHEETNFIPPNMEDMMKYLPQGLQDSFKTLLNPTKPICQRHYLCQATR